MFGFGKSKLAQSLTGVVPGTTGIAIAQVQQQNKGQPVLEMCDFVPLAVNDDTDLGKQLKGRGLDKQHCVTVMALSDYQLLVVDAPKVPEPELRAAIRWKIQDMIDFHIDDAALDVFDEPVSSAAQEQKKLSVCVARSATVMQRIDQLEKAGVNLEIIDIPELAIRNIAARLPEDTDGLATLYFEQGRCLITITRQSILYLARNLDIGYQHLLEGSQDPQSFRDRLALEIQRSMDYYERSFLQVPVRNLIVMPAPVAIPGLIDALQQSLGLPTRTITMNEVVECSPELDNEMTAHCLIAIGAALRTEARTL
jgi:MSHA biogenesis protein MshI